MTTRYETFEVTQAQNAPNVDTSYTMLLLGGDICTVVVTASDQDNAGQMTEVTDWSGRLWGRCAHIIFGSQRVVQVPDADFAGMGGTTLGETFHELAKLYDAVAFQIYAYTPALPDYRLWVTVGVLQ